MGLAVCVRDRKTPAEQDGKRQNAGVLLSLDKGVESRWARKEEERMRTKKKRPNMSELSHLIDI